METAFGVRQADMSVNHDFSLRNGLIWAFGSTPGYKSRVKS
jgi:hypothetical protein